MLTVNLNSDDYISDIHYDSKGRREAIWYGNGTKTAYTYDPNSYRLTRLRTIVTLSGDEVQDLNYWYDAVGNITQIKDSAQQTLYFAGSVVNPAQNFTYDSLYRLITAAGREQIGSATFGSNDNNDDAAWISPDHPGNNSIAVQNYTQNYSYDEVGNILSLQHTAGSGSFTRDYNYGSGNSRLNSTDVGATNYPYTYDNRGNMLTMPHLSAMVWNPLNELQKTSRGTTDTYFNYSGGERIRKVCEKSGGIKEERIYLGSYEIYRKFVSGSLTLERTTVHVSDDTGRIAMLEARTVGTDASAALLTRYVYSNHLQSATLELDENAAIISYEEYHPFGTTAYQASNTAINAVAKRYRYTGKERDEETGLYYHGARYYIPWLGRWSASDPINSEIYNCAKGKSDKNMKRLTVELTASSYEYCYDNPIMYDDPSGEQPPPKKGITELGNGSQGSSVPTVDNTQDVRSKTIIIPETTEKHPYSKGEYIVRKDDNLTKISQKFGVSIDDLVKMNKIENKNKLAIGQILKVAPERDFTNNPRGGYQNLNNSVGVEYTIDNMFSAGAQFFYGLGSENVIVVAGKSLDALRNWDKVQNFINKGTEKLWEDGKLTAGETNGNSYGNDKDKGGHGGIIHYNSQVLKGKEKFWTPIHVIGSFNFSMRVNSDGQSITVAVYDSKTISSLSDNYLGQDANKKNNSSSGRNPFTTQYIRFIWKIYSVR